ncbi:hypothetical protein A2U01_0024535, partial [Trifolium medium]|nr:hypothetical protein [Trifolium medium]
AHGGAIGYFGVATPPWGCPHLPPTVHLTALSFDLV